MKIKKIPISFRVILFLGISFFLSWGVGNAATVYNLSSPIPAQTNFAHVIQGRQSYASQHIMWRDPQGSMNLINSFGGSDAGRNENAYFHYINAGTGAHALVEGGACSFGRNSVYNSFHNKFYWYGEYCSRSLGGSLNEFDPVTMTNTVLSTSSGYMQIAMGGDNRIYTAVIDSENNGRIHSYDPAVGSSSWKDYGVIYGKSTYISPEMAVDNQHIYVSWQDDSPNHYMHLMVHPIGSGSWEERIFADGLPSTSIRVRMERLTKKLNIARLTEGSSTYSYYWLENGNIIPVSGSAPQSGSQAEMDVNMKGHVSMMSVGDYNSFLNAFNYDMNWDYNMPNPANPKSTVYYGPHSTWQYPNSGFQTSTLDYSGPWYDLETKCVESPQNTSRFFAIGESLVDYNYQSQTPNYVYMRNLPSVYYSLLVPAAKSPLNTEEVYISGYPGQFWRWNPALPWSTDNPKAITLNQGANYRLFMDYDANGKIWIGSNVCGATPGCVDYGTLAWYDPATGEKGEMFQGVWTGGNPPATGNGIKFTNFAMSNNRTKLTVSSNDAKLTVINTLTKTIEGEYTLGKKAFMTEVADDRVLGVTKDGDPSQVFLFQPSTRTMIKAPQATGVSGQTFGNGDGSIARRQFKLEKGPDGYAWLYVDSKIYRINPTTLAFEYIATDPDGPRKLRFASNKKDLILYGMGKTKVSYIPNILTEAQGFLPADINEDDHVNLTDFNILKSDFLKLTANLTNPRSDIDGDGQATIKDVGIMMSGWRN